MNAKQHKDLLEKYLQNGGSERVARSIKVFSLQNYAKLKYEFRFLEPINESVDGRKETGDERWENKDERTKNKEPTTKSQQPTTKPSFGDFISQYPVELHGTYQKRMEAWLKACSLKTQLNEVSILPTDEKRAFDIQMKIYKCFQELDECQKILKHYQEHKRIMPTETKTDFSKMSELQIHSLRNNLRSNITRRKQTIEKMENDLKTTEPTARQLHSLNLKREQLQEKINELLECNKILNDGEI